MGGWMGKTAKWTFWLVSGVLEYGGYAVLKRCLNGPQFPRCVSVNIQTCLSRIKNYSEFLISELLKKSRPHWGAGRVVALTNGLGQTWPWQQHTRMHSGADLRTHADWLLIMVSAEAAVTVMDGGWDPRSPMEWPCCQWEASRVTSGPITALPGQMWPEGERPGQSVHLGMNGWGWKWREWGRAEATLGEEIWWEDTMELRVKVY